MLVYFIILKIININLRLVEKYTVVPYYIILYPKKKKKIIKPVQF